MTKVSTTYDPDAGPDPITWRSTGSHDQMRLVISHHMQNRIRVSDSRMHALLHVTIENMLLQAKGPTTRALARLLAAGHPRHQAIHILATVWLAYPVGFTGDDAKRPHQEQQLALNASMDAISGESWLQLHKQLRSKLKKDLQ
jgi:hypothetical protein